MSKGQPNISKRLPHALFSIFYLHAFTKTFVNWQLFLLVRIWNRAPFFSLIFPFESDTLGELSFFCFFPLIVHKDTACEHATCILHSSYSFFWTGPIEVLQTWQNGYLKTLRKCRLSVIVLFFSWFCFVHFLSWILSNILSGDVHGMIKGWNKATNFKDHLDP